MKSQMANLKSQIFKNWKLVVFDIRNSLRSRGGFTLIELLVVIAVLALLVLIFLANINPGEQFKKSRDAQRKSDLNEVGKAINLYYDDHQCFPTSIPWGLEWKENSTIYMKKVPNGPTCSGTPSCTEYTYITGNTCPQWYSIFSDQERFVSLGGTNCSLASLSACTPQNFNSEKGVCVFGGDVDCSTISSSSLTTPTPTSVFASPTLSPTKAPTPTFTPTPIPCSKNYSCTPAGALNAKCNSIAPAGTGTYCESNCRNECPGDR